MPLHNGDLVGAYKIITPLGQGGMATVYKAYHERLNRFVAIKMIHQAYLGDPNFLARFEREAQIVAALEHSNIVPVYDFSEHEGEPYLVMKLVEGSTLKSVLSSDPLPVDDILAVMTPIGNALDYAHSKGVLHRDIKPSNIILDKQATPYLTDFGLARLSISGATTLSTDMMIGTPYYMSPEQAVGKGEVDHRADLYSLGVVFYELFVGTVPFSEGTPYAIINDHIARDLPMPSSLNPDVPIEIEVVLLRALSKDPDDRYQTANELVEAIRNAVNSTQQQITILSEGRQPAAVSLAKQLSLARELSQTNLNKPSSTTREGKRTDVVPAALPEQAKAHAKRGSRWLVETGVIVVGVLAIIVLGAFALNRRQDNETIIPTQAVLVQAATATDTTQPTVTRAASTATYTPLAPTPPATAIEALPPTRLPPQSGNPNGGPPPPPTMMPIPYPDMGLSQAQDALGRGEYMVGNYLALYKGQLLAGDITGARQTLADGVSYAPAVDAYWMTTASISVDAGNYDLAFLCYSQALDVAQGRAAFPSVRWTAGEFLYRAATLTNRLTLTEIRGLSQELAQSNSPIVTAMIGRAFLTNGNDRLAAASITKAIKLDANVGEVLLVYGELLQAQGNSQQAQDQWLRAIDTPGLPQWVRDRVNELLNSPN